MLGWLFFSHCAVSTLMESNHGVLDIDFCGFSSCLLLSLVFSQKRGQMAFTYILSCLKKYQIYDSLNSCYVIMLSNVILQIRVTPADMRHCKWLTLQAT